MELFDNHASIEVIIGNREIQLVKHEITQLQIINNVIKVGGRNPLKAQYIRYDQVTEPVTSSIEELLGLMLEWIENCGCVQGTPVSF